MLWSVLAQDIASRLKNVSVLFFAHPLCTIEWPQLHFHIWPKPKAEEWKIYATFSQIPMQNVELSISKPSFWRHFVFFFFAGLKRFCWKAQFLHNVHAIQWKTEAAFSHLAKAEGWRKKIICPFSFFYCPNFYSC